jgi:hypothetical protein
MLQTNKPLVLPLKILHQISFGLLPLLSQPKPQELIITYPKKLQTQLTASCFFGVAFSAAFLVDSIRFI